MRPLPTPAPSPMRKPARCPLGSRTSCCCMREAVRIPHSGRDQVGTETPPCGRGSVGRPWGHLAGVGDSLQLQGRQDPTVRGRQGEGVGDVRGRDAGQCAGLHHTVWVLHPNLGWRGVIRVSGSAAGDQDGGGDAPRRVRGRPGWREGSHHCFAGRIGGQTHGMLAGPVGRGLIFH